MSAWPLSDTVVPCTGAEEGALCELLPDCTTAIGGATTAAKEGLLAGLVAVVAVEICVLIIVMIYRISNILYAKSEIFCAASENVTWTPLLAALLAAPTLMLLFFKLFSIASSIICSKVLGCAVLSPE